MTETIDAAESTGPPAREVLRRRQRRASPRRKVLGLLIAVLVVWGGFEAYWRLTAVPMPMVDHHARVHDLAASYQPADGANGWEKLIEALAAFETYRAEALALEVSGDWLSTQKYMRDGGTPFLYFAAFRGIPYEPERFPRVAHVLDGMRDDAVMALLDEAIASPRMLRPQTTGAMLLNVNLGNLSKFQHMSRALAADMRRGAAAGDDAELIRCYERVLGVSRACSSQPFTIDRLVGIAISMLPFIEMRSIIIEGELDEDTCRALLAVMDRQCDWPPWELQLESERSSMLDVAQNVFTDDGHGDGRLDPNKLNTIGGLGVWPGAPGGARGHVSSMVLAGRRETTDMLNGFFDQLIEASRLDQPMRQAGDFNADVWVMQLSSRFLLLRGLLPAIGRGLTQGDYGRLYERATRLMLHLEIHRLRHGDYPETLDELDGPIDPALLTDPMSGRPIVYRRIEPDAWGRSYVLYGLGIDGINDDPGRPMLDLENEFLRPSTGLETDILLNTRRDDREDDGG